VQAILLDGLLRILAYLTLQGSFTSREQAILKELLQQLGTDPDEALQRIQHYLRQGTTLEPTLLIRNLAQQLTLPERFLFYAYLIQLAHGDRDLTLPKKNSSTKSLTPLTSLSKNVSSFTTTHLPIPPPKYNRLPF
jgi:hypothetical protein